MENTANSAKPVDRQKLLAYLEPKIRFLDINTPIVECAEVAWAGILVCKIKLGEFDVDGE